MIFLQYRGRRSIQKVCHSPGGRGLTKKCDIGGRGYEPKSGVTPSKIYCFKDRIAMTLTSKVVIRPLNLLVNVASYVDS